MLFRSQYALLTNFVALKGGTLKREQMISGEMADIFSNLYLALSVKYYHENNNASIKLTNYIIEKLINENQQKINTVVENLGPEKYLLMHLKRKVRNRNYKEERALFNEIMNNENIMKEIKKNIYIPDNSILNDFSKLKEYKDNQGELEKIKSRIINVGEYNIN